MVSWPSRSLPIFSRSSARQFGDGRGAASCRRHRRFPCSPASASCARLSIPRAVCSCFPCSRCTANRIGRPIVGISLNVSSKSFKSCSMADLRFDHRLIAAPGRQFAADDEHVFFDRFERRSQRDAEFRFVRPVRAFAGRSRRRAARRTPVAALESPPRAVSPASEKAIRVAWRMAVWRSSMSCKFSITTRLTCCSSSCSTRCRSFSSSDRASASFLQGVGLFGFGVARLSAAESALRRRHRLAGRRERMDGRIELPERLHRGRQCRRSAGDCWPGFASPDRESCGLTSVPFFINSASRPDSDFCCLSRP